MFHMEYLLVYKNDGTPLFSRCYGSSCSMKDDILLCALLAGLEIYATYNAEPIHELAINEDQAFIEYNHNRRIRSLDINGLKMHFFHSQTYTIAIRFGSNHSNVNVDQLRVQTFIKEVKNFVKINVELPNDNRGHYCSTHFIQTDELCSEVTYELAQT